MKRSPLRRRSKKTADLYRKKRIPLIKEMIEANTPCELGPIIMKETHWMGCAGRASTYHEKRKRSAGGSIINRENIMASCHNCNMYVEQFPEVSHHIGLVLREGDAAFEEMGRRNDR